MAAQTGKACKGCGKGGLTASQITYGGKAQGTGGLCHGCLKAA